MLMHFVQDVCDTKEGQSSRGLEPAMPGAFPSDWQHLKRFFNTNLLSQGQPNRPLHGGFSRQALQGESPTCVGLRCQVKLISNVQIPEILRWALQPQPNPNLENERLAGWPLNFYTVGYSE